MCQTHEYSYHYYTAEDWAMILSDATIKEKMRYLAKVWLKWGLVYPSGPTFRVGLATIIVASKSTIDADTAYELLAEFTAEFRNMRGLKSSCRTTFKLFPYSPHALLFSPSGD